jgi:hypothetical protein
MTFVTEGAAAGEMKGDHGLLPDDMDGNREEREKAVDDLLKNLQNFNKP